MIADIDEGRNPSREEEAERLSPTVAELAHRFIKEYLPDHCKPRMRVEYRHAVERYILPALGSIKVTVSPYRRIEERARRWRRPAEFTCRIIAD